MNKKEFENKLNEFRKNNRKDINNNKGNAIHLINEAKDMVLVVTDAGQCYLGNNFDLLMCLSMLFDKLVENKMINKEMLIDLAKDTGTRFNSQNDIKDLQKLNEALDKLKKIADRLGDL